jgi:hypothetical protein
MDVDCPELELEVARGRGVGSEREVESLPSARTLAAGAAGFDREAAATACKGTVSDKSDQVFLTFEQMTMWGQTKQYELYSK